MKELTDDQKKSIWTRLGALVGFSEKADVKLADYVAKDGSTISIDDASGAVQGEVADGEYELEDGKILVITDGKLETIKDAPAAEEAPVEAAVEDAPATEAPADDKQATIDELTAENDKLKAEIEALKAAVTNKDTQLAAIDAKPADKKVHLSANAPKALTLAQAAWDRYKK